MAYRGHWGLLGFGYWAVEEKTFGQYIGELGFADFKRDMRASIEEMPELGWVLMSQAQGQGYATEGLRAAQAWGDAHFGLLRTVRVLRQRHGKDSETTAPMNVCA